MIKILDEAPNVSGTRIYYDKTKKCLRELVNGQWVDEGTAFNDDKFAQQAVARLVKQYNIKTIIETGTYYGTTTKYLATLGPTVHTIEINSVNSNIASVNINTSLGLDNNTLVMHSGNSPDVLNKLLCTVEHPVLMFLDAHWGAYWPLRDELVVIGRHKKAPPVLVIHDFKVPGKDFGYDSYAGRDLDYAYVADLLPAIYDGAKWRHTYNSEAEGCRRGILYVTPEFSNG